jgi:uncharacterized protein YdiU (UPF0061 family)
LTECLDEDVERMQASAWLLQPREVDMTLFFRALADVDLAAPTLAPFADAFYDEAGSATGAGIRCVAGAVRLRACNATRRRRPRGARACRPSIRATCCAITWPSRPSIAPKQGDDAGIHELLDVLRRPYDDQPGREPFAQRRPDWAHNRAGCSMLSCSS